LNPILPITEQKRKKTFQTLSPRLPSHESLLVASPRTFRIYRKKPKHSTTGKQKNEIKKIGQESTSAMQLQYSKNHRTVQQKQPFKRKEKAENKSQKHQHQKY
jgi:hypothetical protein